MPFFEPLPDLPPIEHDEYEFVDPYDRFVEGVVPRRLLLGRTDSSAVVVREIALSPLGLSFTLTAVLRRTPPAVLDGLSQGWPGWNDSFGDLRVGLLLADGTRLESGPARWRHHPEDDGTYRLEQGGGSSGVNRSDESYRLEPGPPPGPITFACTWPSAGIEEGMAEVEAELLATAAAESIELWPPD